MDLHESTEEVLAVSNHRYDGDVRRSSCVGSGFGRGTIHLHHLLILEAVACAFLVFLLSTMTAPLH